jgi:hypothetical protein
MAAKQKWDKAAIQAAAKRTGAEATKQAAAQVTYIKTAVLADIRAIVQGGAAKLALDPQVGYVTTLLDSCKGYAAVSANSVKHVATRILTAAAEGFNVGPDGKYVKEGGTPVNLKNWLFGASNDLQAIQECAPTLKELAGKDEPESDSTAPKKAVGRPKKVIVLAPEQVIGYVKDRMPVGNLAALIQAAHSRIITMPCTKEQRMQIMAVSEMVVGICQAAGAPK